MIKNIVFDIGNVLVTFDPKTYFMKYFKEERSAYLCTCVFGHEAWERYDQGIVQKEDLHDIYHNAYPNDYEDIALMLEHWMELMELKEDSFAYLKEMKKQGYAIYLLSNISEDSAVYLKERMPFFNEVDGEILSYAVKVNKPDHRIYDTLLNTYDLKAEETVFLDDNVPNIEQAKAMGIHGVVFTDVEKAAKEVDEIIRGTKAC